MRKPLFMLITIALGLFLILAAGELLVMFVNPQHSMYPRFKFSEQYGSVLYENTTMVEKKSRHFKFSYRINEWGHRGRAIPISNRYERTNIVVLGDSYAFGTGVKDGEEFPAIIQRALEPDYHVINLSVGGYGLTQEIRRFYEFGRLYDPRIVVLQFCSNDPTDNIFNMVTELDHGRFIFRKTNNPLAWVKIHLSHSLLQKSQLYNLVRYLVYESVHEKGIVDARIDLQNGVVADTASAGLPEETIYNDLLEAFANDLKRRGIQLVMISVNGHLGQFPAIARKVSMLHSKGALEYVDVIPWFSGVTDYGSPQGHSWGTKAHALLGQKLAMVVRAAR